MDHYRFEFTTAHFPVEPFEEDEINTGGDFGKGLTRWLAEQLQLRGVATEPLSEDWGRWLIVHWQPFFLAVRTTGLGPMGASLPDQAGNVPAEPAQVGYAVWIHAKRGWFDRLLGRHDPGPECAELRDVVQTILRGVPGLSELSWVGA